MKTYSIGSVTYGFSLKTKKWEFRSGNFIYLALLKGLDNAQKAANIINGAMKRGGMDNLARHHLSKLM